MCDIKKELKNYNNLKKRLKELKKEKNLLKLEGGKLYSNSFSERVQNSNISDSTCNQALYNIEKIQKLDELIKLTEFEINTLEKIINMLPAEERKIVTYRYINKYNWVKISNLTGHSERAERNKINNSIKRLEFIFNKYGYIA